MAAFKQASVSAAIAFSPIGPYLAAGTVAGGIDDSFSTTSSLQVVPVSMTEVYRTQCRRKAQQLRPIDRSALTITASGHGLPVIVEAASCPCRGLLQWQAVLSKLSTLHTLF